MLNFLIENIWWIYIIIHISSILILLRQVMKNTSADDKNRSPDVIALMFAILSGPFGLLFFWVLILIKKTNKEISL